MEKLLAMTKEIYGDLIDFNGELYSAPQGRVGKRQLRSEATKFLQDYITFIMSSRIVCDTTRMYIRSSSGSVAAAIRTYNEGRNEKERIINVKTGQSAVDYDRKKLLKFFPNDMLYNVIYQKDCDLTSYKRMLSMVKRKYNKEECLSDKIVLNLSRKNYCHTLSDEEFEDLIPFLITYSKKTIKMISEDRITADMVGYFNHLQFEDELSEIDEKRLKELKVLLGE